MSFLIEDAIAENENLVKIFANIPSLVEERCFVKRLCPSFRVLNKDEDVESVYFLCKGSMRVLSEFSNGSIHGFAYVEPGDVIGAMELLSNHKTYSSTLETLTECIVITMAVEDFMKWFEESHVFSKYIAKMIASKFYPTSHDYGLVFKEEAVVVLSRYIYETIKEEIDKEKYVYIKLSRKYLAEELGVSVRTIYRNLNKLSEMGCVVIKDGVIGLSEKEFNKIKEYLNIVR